MAEDIRVHYIKGNVFVETKDEKISPFDKIILGDKSSKKSAQLMKPFPMTKKSLSTINLDQLDQTWVALVEEADLAVEVFKEEM